MAVADLSAAMGQDFKASSIQLGKALNDPIKGLSALRRVGIQFTEQQEKQIEKMVESGDVMGSQKQILKEYINSVDSAPDLRNFYNSKIQELKQTLILESKNIKDIATQVKILEISKYLTELDKNSRVDDSHLVDLLQYYELVKEIRLTNGVQI
jgi:phage-related minor tail protein